jgi:hypothetical protein
MKAPLNLPAMSKGRTRRIASKPAGKFGQTLFVVELIE